MDLFRSSFGVTHPLLPLFLTTPSPVPSLGFSINAHTHAHIYRLYSAVSVIDRTFFWVWGFAGLNPKALVFSGPSWSGSHPVLSLSGRDFHCSCHPWRVWKESFCLSLPLFPTKGFTASERIQKAVAGSHLFQTWNRTSVVTLPPSRMQEFGNHHPWHKLLVCYI